MMLCARGKAIAAMQLLGPMARVGPSPRRPLLLAKIAALACSTRLLCCVKAEWAQLKPT